MAAYGGELERPAAAAAGGQVTTPPHLRRKDTANCGAGWAGRWSAASRPGKSQPWPQGPGRLDPYFRAGSCPSCAGLPGAGGGADPGRLGPTGISSPSRSCDRGHAAPDPGSSRWLIVGRPGPRPSGSGRAAGPPRAATSSTCRRGLPHDQAVGRAQRPQATVIPRKVTPTRTGTRPCARLRGRFLSAPVRSCPAAVGDRAGGRWGSRAAAAWPGKFRTRPHLVVLLVTGGRTCR